MSTLDQLRITPINVSVNGLFYTGVPLKILLGEGYGLTETAVLPAVKDLLGVMIDARAEELRGVIATPGSGQAMEYQRVQSEAEAVLDAEAAGKSVDLGQYPMLATTIGLDIDPKTGAVAVDIFGVARSIAVAAQAFATHGAPIRKARLFGRAAVEAASTIAAAAAAFDAIEWPSLAA